ncbi:MAG: hypothetical protein ACPGNV_04295 [Mangrovicoccus sp.]
MTHQNAASEFSLRDRLRTDTAAAHAAVDALLLDLKLDTAAGLADFLAVQYAGFCQMRTALPNQAGPQKLNDVIWALEQDLQILGRAPLCVTAPNHSAHPVAAEYLTLGSRMGAAALRPKWRASSDQTVQKAQAFFTLPSVAPHWRDWCDWAKTQPGLGPQAEAILQSAKQLFSGFETAARQIQQTKAA